MSMSYPVMHGMTDSSDSAFQEIWNPHSMWLLAVNKERVCFLYSSEFLNYHFSRGLALNNYRSYKMLANLKVYGEVDLRLREGWDIYGKYDIKSLYGLGDSLVANPDCIALAAAIVVSKDILLTYGRPLDGWMC